MEFLATTSDQKSTPFGFLDLPTEIRIEVYQHLFEAARLSIEAAHVTSQHCGFNICSCAFPWHIINTCRRLRQEALPYLLAATTLTVSSTLTRANLIPAAYLSAIPRAVVLDAKAFSAEPFQLERFVSLRTLELRNITIWCKVRLSDASWTLLMLE
jgi:hypothetical protein